MTIKIKPRTQDDFKWINFNSKQLEKVAEQMIEKKKADLEIIKSIPKEQRNFENTIYALEQAGHIEGIPGEIFAFFMDLSPKKKEREVAFKLQQKVSPAMIDLVYDENLYKAFSEYNPKKEKLSEPQKRLYKDALKSFKDMGFHLSKEDQKILKEYNKKISNLSEKFLKNVNDFSTSIFCIQEELEGLPDNYIANLPKDAETGKYKIVYSYATYAPFMQFVKSDKKRKEFADKVSQKGGKKNLVILQGLFNLRHKMARLLGYNNYADFVTEDRLVKNQKGVFDLLLNSTQKLEPLYREHLGKLHEFKSSKTGVLRDTVTYYDSAFYSNLHTVEHFGLDSKKLKEYFEMEDVLVEMFSFFGNLFGVSFVENKGWKLWHKEVRVFDVKEKGKVIAHLTLDLHPREGKYSHVGCWNFMRGHDVDLSQRERLAPLTIILGNFPKGSKKHPTLFSFWELEAMFHEFGHACHDMLTKAVFDSQGGAQVNRDFVETPSQLFEQFLLVPKLLQKFTKHYKTREKMSLEIVEKIINKTKKNAGIDMYGQFLNAFLDQEFHSGKNIEDIQSYGERLFQKHGFVPSSPKSLFPAGFGHLIDHGASYYVYMYSLVLTYDFFSRFEKEGYTNKKTGKALRTVLEKGGSYDEMTYIKEFLGRKPNNKAFLKALGIK